MSVYVCATIEHSAFVQLEHQVMWWVHTLTIFEIALAPNLVRRFVNSASATDHAGDADAAATCGGGLQHDCFRF